jgi:ribosomal protein L44E
MLSYKGEKGSVNYCPLCTKDLQSQLEEGKEGKKSALKHILGEIAQT